MLTNNIPLLSVSDKENTFFVKFRYLLLLAVFTGILTQTGCIVPKKGPRKAYVKAAKEGLTPFDAVIVPGIPYHKPGWDSVMKARVIWSWILYKNGYAKNIIYSGGAIYSPYVEAKIMGTYGQALGIPMEHIYYDTLARHSTENVYFSYLLAKEEGFKTIAVATDPFQSFMLRSFTRKRFVTPVYHLPFITDSLAAYNYLNPVIDPKPARKYEWQSIKEKESFTKRFKGTLGKEIDFTQYPDGKVGPL